MGLNGAWNMYIFRDGRSIVGGRELLNAFVDELRAGNSRTRLISLLLRAGEVECALRDMESPHAATGELLTDLLAEALVSGTELEGEIALELAKRIEMPEQIRLSTPEGFAYYALHPLTYEDLLDQVEVGGNSAAIVGIRSVGTTLGAVTRAAMRKRGVSAERITVRPSGHPYDRRCELTNLQREWTASMRSRGAEFLVVDEGPGMSGSSFLSVGEALLSAGVPRSKITFLCSRQPNVESLTSRNAATRWPAFRAAYPPWKSEHLPEEAKTYVGGGIWRAQQFGDEANWPASWTHMERPKYTSEDGRLLLKFEGFGRFGAEVHERARKVAEAGFGPMPLEPKEGFGRYPIIAGQALTSAEVATDVLRSIGRYCAWRADAIVANDCDNSELERMLRFNTHEEFGVELPAEVTRLAVVRPVIADGRMLPHKWLRTTDGKVLKVDNAIHGDEHFFPGPTDIAWDLAGAIVEWGLDARAQRALVAEYRAAAGEDPRDRLPAYLMAYATFRMGFCKMASAAMWGSYEQERLVRAYEHYRGHVERLMFSRHELAKAG